MLYLVHSSVCRNYRSYFDEISTHHQFCSTYLNNYARYESITIALIESHYCYASLIFFILLKCCRSVKQSAVFLIMPLLKSLSVVVRQSTNVTLLHVATILRAIRETYVRVYSYLN
jgi:hypothetical protein